MKVLVIEDHTLYRQGLALLLAQRFEGLEVFEAASLAEALNALRCGPAIGLALCSLELVDSRGSEAVRQLRAAGHDGALAVLAEDLDARQVAELVLEGVVGYIPKTLAADAVESAIRTVLAGHTYLPRREDPIRSTVPASTLGERRPTEQSRIIHELDLSERQVQVLALMAQGCSNKDIARRLDLLESTVKTHALAVFRKLGVTKRADAVLAATRLGLTFEDQALRREGP